VEDGAQTQDDLRSQWEGRECRRGALDEALSRETAKTKCYKQWETRKEEGWTSRRDAKISRG
jgi:hypothetical protein